MKTLAIFPFNEKTDLSKIDPRLLQFIPSHWKASQFYKGKIVHIPGTWDSKITILNYFQVRKISSDPNPGEDENEIGLTLMLGWFPYDVEIIINLRIAGKDVMNPSSYKVSAEILKCGGADMALFLGNTLVTNFKKRNRWWTIKQDKVWIEDLTKLFK